MKLGVSLLATHELKLEENLEYYENLGIEYLEIIHDYPNNIVDLNILNSYNLKYTIHSPFIDLNIASLNQSIKENSVKEVKKSIDLANKLNSEIVVVHPGNIPFNGHSFEDKIYNIANQSIKEIGNYGNDLGVICGIENMPSIDGFLYQDIEKLDKLLKEYEMFMTLDIGHGNTLGFSPEEMYFDSIKHIHLHDNNGYNDSHLTLGKGNIDLKSIVNIFKRNNYNGIYIIEVINKDSIEKSIEYFKSII